MAAVRATARERREAAAVLAEVFAAAATPGLALAVATAEESDGTDHGAGRLALERARMSGGGPRGSIAHSLGLGVAATTEAEAVVGIDVEGKRLSARGARIFHEPSLLAWIDAAAGQTEAADRRTIAFAAKEAVFKACVTWESPPGDLRAIDLAVSADVITVAGIEKSGGEDAALRGARIATTGAGRWLCAWVWGPGEGRPAQQRDGSA